MRGRITGVRQARPRPIKQQQRRDTRWAPVLSRITGARQKRGDPIEQRHDGPRAPMLSRVARARQKRTDAMSQPRSGPRAPVLSRWALAACLAVAVVSGGGAVWQHQRAEDARDRARGAVRAVDAIAAVLAAPDARTRATGLAGGATGSVVVSRKLDRAVLLVTGMGRPPGGKVYQLWFDEDGTMRPAGLMDPGRADQAVLLRGAVDGASGMGITLEPEGGSGRPTSTPVAVLAFPG
ncbi:anti-sigma factor [Streptomyces sp. SID13726]|nr:anti-sigma factor [Streptomyces sp. SID13726]